ncbi:MAG: S53 family peptidase [Candidatus Eremiobacteraeota bacterium]|nr:S53 family peptidase [Candidatus Eremiobacteraeota bacterium]
MVNTFSYRLGAVAMLAALAACSGNSNSSLPATATEASKDRVPVGFHIVIPQNAVTPKYISTGTKSASITVNGSAAQVVQCTSSCSATVLAPIGNDAFAVSLYDDTAAKGNLLSTGSLTQAIAAGVANSVNISFSGVIASLAISASPVLIPGATSETPITVTAKDATGNTIVGNYTTTVTLTNSDTSGDSSVSPTSVTSNATPIAFNYNGAGGFPGTAINASSGGVTAAAPITVASFKSGCINVHTQQAISGLYPCDLQNAYSIASQTSAGTGKTVAIVDAYDYPNAEADLATYRTMFNLPACTKANGCFKQVDQNGGTTLPATDSTGGWEGEESLDLDAVSATCPNCKIVLVEVNSPVSSDLYTGVKSAATVLKASVISNSWSSPEYPTETAKDITYFNNPGIPDVFATGDSDYQGNPQYPTSSPYVTAAGGTSLVADNSARGWTETVWNNYPAQGQIDQGTQGGCSLYEPKPAWQTDTGCTMRMTADVSAVADPVTGIAVYNTNNPGGLGWGVVGGTSLATPVIAGMYALSSNTASINDGSYPYSHRSQYYDVVSGNSLGASGVGTSAPCAGPTLYFCTAQAGYDGPTGIGTPNGIGGIDPLSINGHSRIPARSPDVVQRLAALRGLPTHPLCAPSHQPRVMACHAIAVDISGL